MTGRTPGPPWAARELRAAATSCTWVSYDLGAGSPAPATMRAASCDALPCGKSSNICSISCELRLSRFDKSGAVSGAFIICLHFVYRKNLNFFEIYGIIYIENKKEINFIEKRKFEYE
jgi:hypothetical protein